MNKRKVSKQKWISEAAYYKSLQASSSSQQNDWIAAEQDYWKLEKKQLKSGLVRIV